MENYKLTEAARALAGFTDELSNWYVPRCRERFGAAGMERDKIDAYLTLYEVLTALAKLTAPFIPFIADDVYRNIVTVIDKSAPISVHLCDFPAADDNFIDAELEKNMDLTLGIVTIGRAARNTAAIKTRQPVGLMYVKAEERPAEGFIEIIRDELNVKEIVFTDDTDGYTSYKFKPQLKTVGPKYGKLMPKINEALQNGDGNLFMRELNEKNGLALNIDGEDVFLTNDDLLIESAQKDGFTAETAGGTTVVLNTVLSGELIEEGFVRELVSKFQTMRKEAGFEVMDRITAGFAEESGNTIKKIIDKNAAEIKKEVLADEIKNEPDGYVKKWTVNGVAVTLGVKKGN